MIRSRKFRNFEGHQPDIEAMKLLYDHPEELIEVTGTQVSNGEIGGSNGESSGSNGESSGSNGESNRFKVIALLSNDGNLTLPELAERLHLSLSGVGKIVRQLKKDGILFRKGSTKAGEWIVRK